MEPEESEERGSGRSQNVVHTLPRSMASVPNFLTGPLERVDPAAGATQVLVLTADAESAVAMAEAVLRMTGPAGIKLLPVTSARRTSRLMAGRPVLAAAGSPRDIRDLVRGSHLKLDSIKSVVLAWADEILAGDPEDIEALEAVMNELPKDAARIVVTSRSEGRVNAFAERYLRRARRDAPADGGEGASPVPLQFVTVSATSRATALRRLLDDLDPPSAVVIALSDQTEEAVSSTLRLLGYGPEFPAVKVSRGAVAHSTHAVIFYDLPASHAQLAEAAAAGAVSVVVLAEPRELSALRRMSGGEVRPFTLAAPGDAARGREAAMRRELSGIIDSGLAARDLLALEPLLERHDGIEIAAAALRLLEKERVLAARREQKEHKEPREAADRGERTAREDRPRGFGGSRGSREGGARGSRDSGSHPGGGGPGRRDSGDRRPPRDGYARPPRRDR